MKINITSVPVLDQQLALEFYTQKLGFVKQEDVPMGEHRWLTLVSPEGPAGIELLLEPMAFEPAKVYYKALYDAGIPATSFETSDLQSEYQRLKELGVTFTTDPKDLGEVSMAIFDDTCGNLICLTQRH